MEQENKVKVMAVLEAYRLHVGNEKGQNIDYVIRVCQAIIAQVFGYTSRTNWSDDIQAAGLIDYGHDTDTFEQYKRLTDIVDEIKI